MPPQRMARRASRPQTIRQPRLRERMGAHPRNPARPHLQQLRRARRMVIHAHRRGNRALGPDGTRGRLKRKGYRPWATGEPTCSAGRTRKPTPIMRRAWPAANASTTTTTSNDPDRHRGLPTTQEKPHGRKQHRRRLHRSRTKRQGLRQETRGDIIQAVDTPPRPAAPASSANSAAHSAKSAKSDSEPSAPSPEASPHSPPKAASNAP